MEEFLRTEDEWNKFLASLDRNLAGPERGLESWKVGNPLNFDMNLVEARYIVLYLVISKLQYVFQ